MHKLRSELKLNGLRKKKKNIATYARNLTTFMQQQSVKQKNKTKPTNLYRFYMFIH